MFLKCYQKADTQWAKTIKDSTSRLMDPNQLLHVGSVMFGPNLSFARSKPSVHFVEQSASPPKSQVRRMIQNRNKCLACEFCAAKCLKLLHLHSPSGAAPVPPHSPEPLAPSSSLLVRVEVSELLVMRFLPVVGAGAFLRPSAATIAACRRRFCGAAAMGGYLDISGYTMKYV